MSKKQFGFLQGRSTVVQLLKIGEYVLRQCTWTTDYDYIRNILIRSIYMCLFEKRTFCTTCSCFDNLYNARVGVNETTLYCRSVLGLPLTLGI